MMRRPEIGDEELSAYIDGELDAVQHRRYGQRIQADSRLAERVAAFESDMALLRQTYAPIAERPLPASWQERIQHHVGGSVDRGASAPLARLKARGPLLPVFALAATIVLAVICAPLVSRLWLSPQKPDIVAQALAAHSGAVAPQSSVATTARDVASRAISEALAMRLKAPDLSRMGYSLEAVKTYAGARGDRPVELVYRNARNGAFTLYLHRPLGPARFDQFRQGGERVCIWQDDVLGTVMVGEMSAPEMQRLASLSYTGLTL